MFTLAFSNVVLTLLYILPGFLLCKAKKAAAEHLSSLSSVLIYVCSPCMIVSSLLALDATADLLLGMGLFFLVTLALQVLFMLLLFLLLRRRFADAGPRILTIGAVMGNVGFFGMPVIRMLFPAHPEMAAFSCMYCVSMNILIFTVGVFCLTEKKEYMSLRPALLNPTVLSLGAGLVLLLSGAGKVMPAELLSAVDLLGRMTAPLCMMILGVRLSAVHLLSLFRRPVVYLTVAMKLLVYPLFCYGICLLFPLPDTFRAAILVLSSVPCASVILNMAEIHHSGQELAANCVLLSTLLCFLTIPLLTLLLPA